MNQPSVSVDDVATHLGVAKDSIYYRWTEGKSMPARKAGRRWKLKVSEVDGWVSAGGSQAAADEAHRVGG